MKMMSDILNPFVGLLGHINFDHLKPSWIEPTSTNALTQKMPCRSCQVTSIRSAKERKKTALIHFVSEVGTPEMVCLLLDRGASAFDRDSNRWKPVHSAALGGNIPVIEMFLTKRILIWPVALAAFPSPLSIAAWEGHVDVVKVLLRFGSDVHGRYGPSPLLVAALANQGDVVRVLLEAGAGVPCENARWCTGSGLEDVFDQFICFPEKSDYFDNAPEGLRALLQAGARGTTAEIRRKCILDLPYLHIMIECGVDIRGIDETNRTTVLHRE